MTLYILNYDCTFKQYLPHAQILMNGIYWEPGIPPLFTHQDLLEEEFGEERMDKAQETKSWRNRK